MNDFADRLRASLPSGCSPNSIAKAMRAGGYDISQQTLSALLLRQRKPSLEMATALADYLELDLNWLAGRVNIQWSHLASVIQQSTPLPSGVTK